MTAETSTCVNSLAYEIFALLTAIEIGYCPESYSYVAEGFCPHVDEIVQYSCLSVKKIQDRKLTSMQQAMFFCGYCASVIGHMTEDFELGSKLKILQRKADTYL